MSVINQTGCILRKVKKSECEILFYRHEHVGTVVHYLMPPSDGKDKKGRHLGLKLLPLEDMPNGVSQMDKEVEN